MRYLGDTDIINILHNTSSKIIFISSIFVCLFGITYLVPFASADYGGADVSSDLSSKIQIGKSHIDENSSSNTSISSQNASNIHLSGNSDTNTNATSSSSYEKSEEQSHENSKASTEMNAESNENYKKSYDKMNADSKSSFTVETEHHLYKPGEQVSIEGSIWTNLMTTVGGISSVSIQVADNGGNVVYSGTGQVNSNGDYSTEFQLPSDAKNGAYTINVKSDTNADVLNTLSLKTQASLQSSTKFVVVSPNAFAIKAEGKDFDVQVATNSSSVTNMKFDEQGKKISFTVQGETGTKGVTEVKIPKSLLSGNLTVLIDGQVMSQSDVIEKENTNDEVTLELNYHHSTHQIDIVGTNAVPEFGSLVSMILVVSILSVIVLSMKTRVLNIAHRS